MKIAKKREAYSSDIAHEQWAEIEPPYQGMRTHKWSKRK